MESPLSFDMIESSVLTPDERKARTYGMTVTDLTGHIHLRIEDISTIEAFTRTLVERCNKGNVSLLHVFDIIEDTLGQY